MVFIRNNINNLLIFCTLCIMFPSELSALDNGKIKGLVLDKVTGNPLPYTNVFLDGTSFGSSTDPKGNFLILDVPPGSYTIKIRYIGYKKLDEQIELGEGQVLERKFSLAPEALEGKTVNVTVQAEGQKAAINQQ